MDDSILLSPSIHLQNVQKLIKNLENTTSNDERFLLESIQFSTEHLDIDSFFNDTSDNHSIENTDQSPMHYPSNSSSTSWKQMKESQRWINETPSKEISSPLNLYKIFQRKSRISHKSTFINLSSSSSSNYHRSHYHKSLPDLSFVTHYSKEIPRSLNTSPLLQTSSSSETNITRTTPSPTLIQQHKQDLDRPRTLKSIKRYKNSKHSTEPFNVYHSSTLLEPSISSMSKDISRIHRSETDLRLSNKSNEEMSRCHCKLFEKDHRRKRKKLNPKKDNDYTHWQKQVN